MVTYADLPISSRLLDAGGGTGRVAVELCDKVGQVIVADISLGMLHQVASKGSLRPTCSYSEWLPFPDKCFDRIIMVDALHHVCDQEKTAGELWRVLNLGGRIVIQEPDICVFIVKLIALVEKLILMRSHILSPSRIAELFSFTGSKSQVYNDGLNSWVVIKKS